MNNQLFHITNHWVLEKNRKNLKAQVYFDDNSGINLFLPAGKKCFCQSAFYHGKNRFFHRLAKTSTVSCNIRKQCNMQHLDNRQLCVHCDISRVQVDSLGQFSTITFIIFSSQGSVKLPRSHFLATSRFHNENA